VASPANYDALVERLFRQNESVIKYDLDAMRRSIAILGLPKLAQHVVLVAGTNGKGTTSATLHAMLRAAGLHVGLFTSPHLVDFRERIRIDGEPISRSDVVELLTPLFEQFGEEAAAESIGRPLSFFEITTLLAARYFTAGRALDVVILEVGMGGRLDATNAFDRDIAVITSISRDHMAWLGDTVEKIAYEKAAIARPTGLNLVHARSGGYDALRGALTAQAIAPTVVTTGNNASAWNRALAARAAGHILALCSFEPDIAERAIAQGRRNARWPARQEIVTASATRWLVDGAHNPASMLECAAWLKRLEARGIRAEAAILGFTPGRDLDETLRPMLPYLREVYVVPASETRSVPPGDVAAALLAINPSLRVVCLATLDEAMRLTRGRTTLVAGSLYLCGGLFAALGFEAEDLKIDRGHAKRSANSR
jgi:dihydrofolate synthase/folylpolyglutamate synthase